MSLDKYIMRGFTGSLGSGEGKWVSTSTPPTNQAASQQTSHQHNSGTRFVLGGTPGIKPSRPASQSHTSYQDYSYSFDSERIRKSGTVRERHSHRECFHATSLMDRLTSRFGKRIAMTICLYALVLGCILFAINKYFGKSTSERSYRTPSSVPRHARPLWDR